MAHNNIIRLIAAITFLIVCHNAFGSTIYNSKSNNTITVEGTSYAKLNSAYDILKKTPGVTINKNNVPIVNSTHEAVVYVNNRKVNDISELKHISASNIKNITVIANPSAQYSGEQQAVILFETIKKLDKGYSILLAIPRSELEKNGVEFTSGSQWLILTGRYNYSRYLPLCEKSAYPQCYMNFHDDKYYARIRFEQ